MWYEKNATKKATENGARKGIQLRKEGRGSRVGHRGRTKPAECG